MTSYLTPEQYNELLTEIDQGEVSLVISRNLARQFFFNVGNRNIRNLTGVSMPGKKAVVVALLFISLALAAFCLALVVREFGWGAIIGVPIVGIFWTVLAGFTTEMGSYLSSTLLTAACAVTAWFLPFEYGITFLFFSLSMYCYLLTHLMAETFLLQLLHTSYDAYDMLCEQIDLEHHER